MGCIEIPIFIKTGTERFENTASAAKLSFLVPFILLPFSAWLALANPGFKDQTVLSLLPKMTFEFILSTALYLSGIYMAVKQLDRAQFFPRFVNAQNWLSITQLVILLPILSGVMAGHWPWKDVYNFLVFLFMYGYVFQAFLITFTFRINWMLASALSILGMAINESVHSLIYQVS